MQLYPVIYQLLGLTVWQKYCLFNLYNTIQ